MLCLRNPPERKGQRLAKAMDRPALAIRRTLASSFSPAVRMRLDMPNMGSVVMQSVMHELCAADIRGKR
jgi:hypothetical protein